MDKISYAFFYNEYDLISETSKILNISDLNFQNSTDLLIQNQSRLTIEGGKIFEIPFCQMI